jgi:hypothetical protein
VIQDHPDGALTHLRRELPGRCVILHGSNLSGSGASGKRGAVQTVNVVGADVAALMRVRRCCFQLCKVSRLQEVL